MKKNKFLLVVLFLISVGSSYQQVLTQEKSKAEKEKDLSIQIAIEQEKKAMSEQKKVLTEAEAAMEEQPHIIKENIIRDIRVEVDDDSKDGETVRIYKKRGNRPYGFDEQFSFPSAGFEPFYGHMPGGDSERTTWDFSRSVKESTFSKEYNFDVEKSVKTVIMSVMGDCKTGEIRVKIIMPNGKNYSEIVIDESGNLNWRKSFNISETENQDKKGEWKFQIASAKATGFFKISLQTY